MQTRLRVIRPLDENAVLDILTDSLIKQTYMLPDYECREDALPLFRRLVELSEDEARYVRGIYLGDLLIGFLNDVEIKDNAIELGYVIHPNHHGKGYMTQALRISIQELFDLGYREIICGAFEENAASIRVMEKAGMTVINQTEQIEYRGKTHKCLYYSVKREV